MSHRASLLPAPAARAALRAEDGPAAHRVIVDTAPENRAWDHFVDSAVGGHHAQSSLWARVKAVLGWQATRVLVFDGDSLVAGVQVLTRAVGRAGRIGFAPRGPVVESSDPRVLDLLQRELLDFSREERVRYLKVQPPAGRGELAGALEGRGWTPSAIEAAPTATVQVDLVASDDEILARMRRSTRHHIRKAMRRGLRVHAGGPGDFAAYRAVVEATSRRQGFAPYPAECYEAMWRVFAEEGRAGLLIAELDGSVVSSVLLLGFGDTATYKMGGWSGERTSVRPNEAVHFAGMGWAKQAGYLRYDFDGIPKDTALYVRREGELPAAEQGRGVAHFKLGFGGEAVLFPGALDIAPNRLLRPLVRHAAPRLDRALWIAHRALGREG